jgi:hypothetical protein
MRCSKVQKRLPLYAGGDLSDAEAARAREHIEACSACREALRSYEGCLGLLGTLKDREAPEGTWRNYWQDIHRELFLKKEGKAAARAAARAAAPVPGRLIRLGPWVRMAAAAAILVLIVFIAIPESTRWEGPEEGGRFVRQPVRPVMPVPARPAVRPSFRRKFRVDSPRHRADLFYADEVRLVDGIEGFLEEIRVPKRKETLYQLDEWDSPHEAQPVSF